VCLFDFRGSGLSAGDYVTYGWREKEDVGAVLEYLGNEFGYEGFVLWGRSMGAATALMYSRNPGRHRILLTIADSSYYDLKQLLLEIGNTQMNIPMFLLRPFLYMV
jgi:pimeloyl-ACP methyl ester carboxylesterase